VTDQEVVIVASVRDTIAVRVARAVERTGRGVIFLDGPAAARMFTIRVDNAATEVIPALPIFVRHSAWWFSWESANLDERFSSGENYSAVWAAASLSPTRVINRPGSSGWLRHLTSGGIRPLLGSESKNEFVELYASAPTRVLPDRPRAEDDESTSRSGLILWGKNAEGHSGAVRDLKPDVPLRARNVDVNASYEVVTVVGGRAFSATADVRTAELGLRERSIELAQTAGVHFAAITWTVEEGAAVPVRLNADVTDSDLCYAWDEIENALCEDLVT
jgi:hypothetical protein